MTPGLIICALRDLSAWLRELRLSHTMQLTGSRLCAYHQTNTMVLILDGNSEHDVHLLIVLGKCGQFKTFASTAASGLKLFLRKYLFSFILVQPVPFHILAIDKSMRVHKSLDFTQIPVEILTPPHVSFISKNLFTYSEYAHRI